MLETVPGSAWRRYLNSVGYPLIGPYDSSQSGIMRWQLETARNAGLECLHVHLWPSIWDPGRDFTPLPVFERVLEQAAALDFPVAVHDEVQFRRPNISKAQTPESTIRRATTLLRRYGNHPGWYKWNGMPVYYFQNWSNWIDAGQLQHVLEEVEKAVGPVFWMVQMEPREDIYAIPQVRGVLGPSNGWFLHTPPHGVGPHPWKELESQMRKAVKLGRKYDKTVGILVLTRFNNNNDRGKAGRGRIDAEDGMFFVKSMKLARELEPDFVLLHQWNDFEEGGFIEPARDYDGYNGDPFRYCRITAGFTGTTFTPAPLPARKEVDPFIRHKLFGNSRPGDMGPVFRRGRLEGDTLHWRWGEGSGDPSKMTFVQKTLLSWSVDKPGGGTLRLANVGQLNPGGRLEGKDELRFFVPSHVMREPSVPWIGIKARCGEGGGLRVDYRAAMENYRVDSRWQRRHVITRNAPRISLDAEASVYWQPLYGAKFTGWEGDLIVRTDKKRKPCQVEALYVWSPRRESIARSVDWNTVHMKLPAAIDPRKPFVVCPYDDTGNAGLPRLFYAGRTTLQAMKNPMDLLEDRPAGRPLVH